MKVGGGEEVEILIGITYKAIKIILKIPTEVNIQMIRYDKENCGIIELLPGN